MILILGAAVVFQTAAVVFAVGASQRGTAPASSAEDAAAPYVLEIEEFLSLAVQKDTVFEEILIDELTLQYRKDLLLDSRDLVLAVRSDYQFLLIQDQEAPVLGVSLSKLFPHTGTRVEAEYATTPEFENSPSGFSRTDNRASEYTVLVSQPIAENAFGYAYRLSDKIVGLEIEVISHQIAEAYEDYLASVLTAYLDWYEAYENLKVAESSYRENQKLLKNIEARRSSNIALPIDVNKITLQVMDREEILVEARVRYQNTLNLIRTAIREESEREIIPSEPKLYHDLELRFEQDYKAFRDESRTYHILEKLEKRSSLEVSRNANQLLPSIDLRVGITSSWAGSGVRKEENLLFAGVSMAWPLPDQIERAEHKVSKINRDRAVLTTTNTHFRLYTDLRNLYEEVEREGQLLDIAAAKIEIAEKIFQDESENYIYGKVTLNDYIQAVNDVDSNRFNRVFHITQQKRLIIEILRLMDRLVFR